MWCRPAGRRRRTLVLASTNKDEVRVHAQVDPIPFLGILGGNRVRNAAGQKRNRISQRVGAIISSEGGYCAVAGGGNDAVA